jgi:hypothetical protein
MTELETLKQQVAELMAWKQKKERQQLSFPIDTASMQALNEAFRSAYFDRINVTDIFFQATRESPTVEGQMRFFNDRSTQTMRITTTTNPPSGSNFTGSVNLTAV